MSDTSSTAPSAAFPGYGLPSAYATRVTSPPSSSIAITGSENATAEADATAERSAAVSALTWPGAAMFGPKSVTPASPRSSASRIQRRRGNPGKRRDQDRVRQPGQGRVRARLQRGHPFTAPATRPARRRRWTSRKKTKTGIVNSVEAAMIAPQSAPFRP